MCAFNRLDNGELGVDGLPLSQIAADHDSPLYVYSGASIRDAYRDFAAAVAPVNGKVHFAMKANSALGILALLAREGAGADIVSGGELSRALAAGMPASDVVFSGVGKSRSEIEQALVANIGQINAESPAEVAVISAVAASMGVVAPVALRVNVDVDAKTHAKISTGQRDTKFGISTDQNEAANLYRVMADDPHIEPSGLAVHIGSQLRDMAPFENAYTALLALGSALRADGLDVPLLDLGGGVGVDYDHASPTDFTAYGAMVKKIFDKTGFKLGFEPGRSIVANSGILLTKVIFIKDGDNKRFVIVDAAMNDLLRPTLYEAHHTIIPVKAPGPDVGMADIVGPVCETGDYIGRDRMMPKLASDDLLAVLSAGAYGAVMASAYNTRPPAGEVLVLDGQVHELRAKRSVESYLAEESIPVF
jgi:diaminopimelate decarboxylase